MLEPLRKEDLHPNPVEQFSRWYRDAEACEEIAYPDAVCLSTLTPDGYPDGRIVLLKAHDNAGFVFYTNTHSAKGQALAKLPRAALTFYWDPLGRQVRIRGDAALVGGEEANAYFRSRDRRSRLGAWASDQSSPIADHAELHRQVERLERRFADREVPRPPHWSGYRIAPREVEFWRFGANRLHYRYLYRRGTKEQWEITALQP